MSRIITIAGKELRLLGRDRAGLLVLFLMPAILVVIITLVQTNVMQRSGLVKTRALFLDLDGQAVGSALYKLLNTENLHLVGGNKKEKTAFDLEKAVRNGKYQVGIVVPKGSTKILRRNIAHLFAKPAQKNEKTPLEKVRLKVFFDPGIMPGLRAGITARLQMAVQTLSFEAKFSALEEVLKKASAELNVPAEGSPLPAAGLRELLVRPVFSLSDNAATVPSKSGGYNPVQQNVIAWALFGIFFTAIPIAGTMIKERVSAISDRLATLPVTPLQLFAGKIAAYVAVCLCQFLLIALLGACLFPHLGLPAFTVTENPAGILLIVLLSSLAACCYGIFLGTACKSFEQASTIGATTVVATAAIGGVMVPVYAMPDIMQRISIISPMNWGLNAGQSLLMRGSSLAAISPDLYRLALFCLLMIVLSRLQQNR
ncbi:MAG TPA: ABC transporter permease [Desulfobulbaceae bacterium]|nr:ABC transporter permease [Desulfobulbaceae bacterium]